MTEAFKRGFMDKMAEFEKDSNMFTDLIARPVAQAARRGAGAVARGVKGLFGRGAAKAAPKITITPEEVAAAKVAPKITITPEEVAAAKVAPNTVDGGVTRTPEQLAALGEMRTKRNPGLTQGRRPLKSVSDLRSAGPKSTAFSPEEWADIDQAVRTAMAGKHVVGDEDVAALAADRMMDLKLVTRLHENDEPGRVIAQKIMEQTEPARMAKHPELGRPGDFDPEPYDVSKLLIGDGSHDMVSLRERGYIPRLSEHIVEEGGVPNWEASLAAAKQNQSLSDRQRRLLESYLEARENKGVWPTYVGMFGGRAHNGDYIPRKADLIGWTPAMKDIENAGREGLPGWRPALFESAVAP